MADLVPNEGMFFDPQLEEQRIAENVERAEVLEVLPFLQDVIDWFDREATQARDIANLELESNIPLSAQVLAWQTVQAKLSSKKLELEAYLEHYKR